MKITVEVEGIAKIGADLQNEIRQVQSFIVQEFQRQVVPRTPIDTGRARRGWRQRTTGSGATVENQEPHIVPLERGRSKQAPNGFVKQAISATILQTKRIIK